jgi:hypothetical protein
MGARFKRIYLAEPVDRVTRDEAYFEASVLCNDGSLSNGRLFFDMTSAKG